LFAGDNQKGNRQLFEIIFLGTSASAPSVRRGLAAQVVKKDEYRFLIDCGEGTQRQILQSGIGFKRLNRILITHGHLDHILGLAGLLSTFLRWETIDELEIFASRQSMDRIRELLFGVVLRGSNPPMVLKLREIGPGMFLETEDFSVTAFEVQHRGSESLGFAFEEKSRRPFIPEQAEALGVPPGPIRRDLASGKSVTLADGRVVTPEEVLGELRPGTRLVTIGDVGITDGLINHVRDADGLVIESTYLEEDAQLAHDFGHLTARQAAELAKRAGVKKLFLTHISRRYREKDVLQEAEAVFPHVVVARDFDTYQIKRD
jgi:ribonuclease Z